MSTLSINPPAPPKTRWFHLVLLSALLALGATLRLNRIDSSSLWIDEYWNLYEATGRGSALFQIPQSTILDPPPRTGFSGAPPWFHIWSGLQNTRHPPVYYVLLRGWVALFGDTDLSTRAMSCFFSLAGAAVLFDAMRRSVSPAAAVIAAGLMALAPMQIDFSQSDRAYTLLPFFTLVLADLVISIDRSGISLWKLLMVSASTFAMALTFYLAFAQIGAISAYIFIRMRGRPRSAALSAIIAGLFLAALLWAPFFWMHRAIMYAFPDNEALPKNRLLLAVQAIIVFPTRLFLGTSEKWNWIRSLPLALLVYVTPFLFWRRRPEALFWSIWIVTMPVTLAVAGLVNGNFILAIDRFWFVVSPAVFAILATPLPLRFAGSVPPVALMCAAFVGIDRSLLGPDPTPDWKTVAKLIDESVRPRDVVAIVGHYSAEPDYDFFVLEHYRGGWTNPVILLSTPPSHDLLRQLASGPPLVVVGLDPSGDTAQFFPGWQTGRIRGAGNGNSIWTVFPQLPSHATRQGSR